MDDSGSFRLSIDHCIGSEINMNALEIGLVRLCVGSSAENFIKVLQYFNSILVILLKSSLYYHPVKMELMINASLTVTLAVQYSDLERELKYVYNVFYKISEYG